MKRRTLFLIALVAGIVVGTIPSAAQDGVILAGSDPWHTPNDGSTTVQVNLPSGFFCPGSAPVDTITLKGEPLETDPPTALGDADTIVQRLNDTVAGGTAQIQVQALCLRGADTLRVGCADGTLSLWDVTVSLDGEQPITEIQIKQDTEDGGTFDGEVAVNAVISFTQVADEAGAEEQPVGEIKAAGETRVVKDSIVFTSTATPWVYDPGVEGVRYESELFVAEGCGGAPVKLLPGTSNFHPGWGVGTPAQIDQSKCKCDCTCGRFCRLPVRERALLAQHGVIPPCRRCNCL